MTGEHYEPQKNTLGVCLFYFILCMCTLLRKADGDAGVPKQNLCMSILCDLQYLKFLYLEQDSFAVRWQNNNHILH